jgi:hypothetical protein
MMVVTTNDSMQYFDTVHLRLRNFHPAATVTGTSKHYRVRIFFAELYHSHEHGVKWRSFSEIIH